MQIRKGTESDIPDIVELLKSSLGEGLIQKTEYLWRWKHVENPHGISPVLVAEEDGQVVGVRAFLRWQWVYKGQVLHALRAVDTATHPDYQGRGIFKKLTLQGLMNAKDDGMHLVYNTPNKSSKPGYLKMGWSEMSRMSLKLRVNPYAYFRKSVTEAFEQDWHKLQSLLPKLSNPIAKKEQVQTLINPTYIQWRYKENPLFNYFFLSDYRSYVLFYRIKPHNFGREMRVVDFLVDEKLFGREEKNTLEASFREISNACFLTAISGRHFELAASFYPNISWIPVMDNGPIVTLRNICTAEEIFKEISTQSSWGYSLGDMELF